MKKAMGLVISLILLAGMLVGCSGTPAKNSTNTPEKPVVVNEQQESPQLGDKQQQQATAWPRTITDAAGHDVVLEKQPQRIAILHSMYLEYFFALDTPPIASAGANIGTAMKALEEFETLKPYIGTADIIDLGSAREINLEAILAADPDVIVTFNGHGGIDQIYDQLVQIAPVVLLDYTATWQDSVRDCAEIIGKEDLAEQRIKETEQKIADARKDLSQYRDKTVVFVRSDGKGGIFALGTARYPYYYDTVEGFGLSKPEGYPEEWGVIALESLAEMNPDYIIFQDFLADAQAIVDTHASSSVWKNIQAVKDGHVFFFDVSLNTTSPLALQIASENLVDALSK